MKKIFFDMDGTLYSFENGQYRGSKLENEVQNNALKLLKTLEGDSYLLKFEEIKSRYGEELSLAFEELYHIKKEDYFDTVWDIQPDECIQNNRNAKEVFQFLKTLGYEIYIVSESPKIWIQRVGAFLELDILIAGVYSGQGDERKSNGKLYEKIKNEHKNQYFMIGDQIQSDINMSKKYGFHPIFISKGPLSSSEASYNITKLTDLYSIIF